MEIRQYQCLVRTVDTRFGRIGFAELGDGPVALLVHGVFLNGALWRHVMEEVADIRRCIAVDLLAHGASTASDREDLSFDAQADMLLALVDALGVRQVDLVGNDSGGAIAQIFAVRYPERVRSLTLTNCDVHDNWPPPAFATVMALVRANVFAAVARELLDRPELARSDFGLGAGYEYPARLGEDVLRAYLSPVLASERAARALQRFIAAWDNAQTTRIRGALQRLRVPTLIAWGTDDVFFPLRWAYWLYRTIPGARRVVELQGARLFFPEERAAEFANELREHWRFTEARHKDGTG